ncbi:MAG TPA: hypothetical protein PLF29_03500 [bacterium]|nr:hypothetical protein [bacterium]
MQNSKIKTLFNQNATNIRQLKLIITELSSKIHEKLRILFLYGRFSTDKNSKRTFGFFFLFYIALIFSSLSNKLGNNFALVSTKNGELYAGY